MPHVLGLSNIHTLRTIEMTPRLVSPNAPCLMGLSNTRIFRTIEMTQDLCLPMPHVYGTLKHYHPQNNRNDTRLVSPNAPCLWDSQTLTPSEQ